ncbi:sulfurtransferase TusA family protein [Archaeoglobus neptunius]|uniref:sulfurtransferase TusA family protein n=1 Tax=Archaeoglobus neptunius TaxID=2798580 RepID=UPI001E2AC7F6|nr:sulfurtransferase TusA family protein [Archaeoglobus neptunius]
MRKHADFELDLRGEVCPFTFIETKLKLEEMKSGEVLEVIVDHEPAARDVPKSIESEGHEVIDVRRDGDVWRIVVRKK